MADNKDKDQPVAKDADSAPSEPIYGEPQEVQVEREGLLEKSPSVGGAKQVQAIVDKQHELGLRGVPADPTPNEHYTVAGVIANKPTPETDDDHAEWVRKEKRNRLTAVGKQVTNG